MQITPTKSFDSVIFDLDGTLTDPKEGFVNCINFAMTSLGRAARPAQTLLCFIGPPIHGTFQSLLGSNDQNLIEEAVSLYRQRLGKEGIRENTLYPGVVKMLAALNNFRKVLFVATAKPLKFAVPILEHCGLQDYFTGVYGSELSRPNSPKGELIRAILQEHGISSANSVMVGDRSHDVLGAQQNSVFSVGVTYGYGSAAELREAKVDLICNNPEQVANTLTVSL